MILFFSYGKTDQTFFNVDDAKYHILMNTYALTFREDDDEGRQCRKRFVQENGEHIIQTAA
jgi:hypothetical protein